MTAFNVVRFLVKPGREEEFIAAHKKALPEPMKGLKHLALIKTGDRRYCFIGEWEAFENIAAARPQMIRLLDSHRDTLEDQGNGLGVTDPVSGTAVVEQKF